MTKLNQLQLISQLYSQTDFDDSSDPDDDGRMNGDNSLECSTINVDSLTNCDQSIDRASSNDQTLSNDRTTDEIKSTYSNTSFIVDNHLADRCIVCLSSAFKYKCPSCLVQTCSLSCFKQHKIKFECTGLRDSLKFKRLANFDDGQLKVDFQFLEDYNRQMDGLKRQKRNIVQSLSDLPNWLKKLKYEANRRLIKLKILPAGFKRRLQNKTTFMYSTKEIHWDVELVFTDLNIKQRDDLDEKLDTRQRKITFHLHRVSEKQLLKDLLTDYIKPTSSVDHQRLNSLLRFYQNADENEISVLIKLSFDYYFELDQQMTINDCLKHKSIIEYPTLFVVLKKNLNNYKLLKEDELRNKMQEYADKSYDLLIKNDLVRKNFNDKSRFNVRTNGADHKNEKNAEDKDENNAVDKDENNDEDNDELDEKLDKSFEKHNDYYEESDDEAPEEIRTTCVYDQSFNDELSKST